MLADVKHHTLAVNYHLLTIASDLDMARTASLGLRIEPHVKVALEAAAKDQRRTVASYVELLLIEHLINNGYLKDEH